jgi:hypothetical protein
MEFHCHNNPTLALLTRLIVARAAPEERMSVRTGLYSSRSLEESNTVIAFLVVEVSVSDRYWCSFWVMSKRKIDRVRVNLCSPRKIDVLGCTCIFLGYRHLRVCCVTIFEDKIRNILQNLDTKIR